MGYEYCLRAEIVNYFEPVELYNSLKISDMLARNKKFVNNSG